MVRIRVSRLPDGCLSELVMSGHVSVAHGGRGANITCAAVTGLVRSCAAAIAAAEGIEAFGQAEHEGDFHLQVEKVAAGRLEWLRGVTDVLMTGLRQMVSDAPDEFDLLEHTGSGIEQESRSREDGT